MSFDLIMMNCLKSINANVSQTRVSMTPIAHDVFVCREYNRPRLTGSIRMTSNSVSSNNTINQSSPHLSRPYRSHFECIKERSPHGASFTSQVGVCLLKIQDPIIWSAADISLSLNVSVFLIRRGRKRIGLEFFDRETNPIKWRRRAFDLGY